MNFHVIDRDLARRQEKTSQYSQLKTNSKNIIPCKVHEVRNFPVAEELHSSNYFFNGIYLISNDLFKVFLLRVCGRHAYAPRRVSQLEVYGWGGGSFGDFGQLKDEE